MDIKNLDLSLISSTRKSSSWPIVSGSLDHVVTCESSFSAVDSDDSSRKHPLILRRPSLDSDPCEITSMFSFLLLWNVDKLCFFNFFCQNFWLFCYDWLCFWDFFLISSSTLRCRIKLQFSFYLQCVIILLCNPYDFSLKLINWVRLFSRSFGIAFGFPVMWINTIVSSLEVIFLSSRWVGADLRKKEPNECSS